MKSGKKQDLTHLPSSHENTVSQELDSVHREPFPLRPETPILPKASGNRVAKSIWVPYGVREVPKVLKHHPGAIRSDSPPLARPPGSSPRAGPTGTPCGSESTEHLQGAFRRRSFCKIRDDPLQAGRMGSRILHSRSLSFSCQVYNGDPVRRPMS